MVDGLWTDKKRRSENGVICVFVVHFMSLDTFTILKTGLTVNIHVSTKTCVTGSNFILHKAPPWQDLQCHSAAVSMPGHQTFVLSFCFVPTMPRCPSCARASGRGRSLAGRMVRVPRNTN